VSVKRFLVLTAVCFVAAFIGSYAAQVRPSGADPACGPGCGIAGVGAGSNLVLGGTATFPILSVASAPSFTGSVQAQAYRTGTNCAVTTSSGAATLTNPVCSVTPGAAGTTFTLTYASPFTNAPACVIEPNTTTPVLSGCTTSISSGTVTATVTFASSTSAPFWVVLVGNGS
jgi:hypothetical protein